MRYGILKTSSAIIIAFALLSITSCGKKTSPPTVAVASQTSVIKTLPWEGAKLIPVNPTVIVDFSNPLSQSNSGMTVTLESLPSGQSVSGQVGIQANYLYFTPSTSLEPLSYYRFTLSGQLYDENDEEVFLPVNGLTFSFETQANNTPMASAGPALINIFPPLPGEVFTNAVFRLTFSQPLFQGSIVYGGDIMITDTTTKTVVPVELIPINNNIILQPVSGLTAGDTYALFMTNTIEGVNFSPVSFDYNGIGNGSEFLYTFTPASAGKETLLPVQLEPAVTLGSNGTVTTYDSVNTSPVPVNVNIVNSQLLGTSIAYLTGYLDTYMGDSAITPSFIPIILPGGQRLYGSALSVSLGGVIPTPLNSGKLSITLLDNATLYMTGNPYQNQNPQAPPVMYGVEDMNLTAQDPITNAVLNQNLMGVQLTGTVTVDKTDGSLIIDFIGITTLNIMGIENAPVTLFLRFRSVPVGWVAPQRDNTFVATGTIPYNGDDRIGTDSSFIVNFSGPVDPNNFQNLISFDPTGSTIGYQTIYNGSSVIVEPYNLLPPFGPLLPIPLAPQTQYNITASAGLASIMGTALNQDAVFSFTTDSVEQFTAGTDPTATEASGFDDFVPNPVIATVFPGDGILPLFAHPYISLDKFIDPTTVVYNQDVFVTDTTAGILVPGGVKVIGKKILFVPSQPLINGDQYTFTLSGGTVKDIDGYPIAQIVMDTSTIPATRNVYFSDTTIHFTATATPWFPILSQELSPFADRDQDGFLDGSEVTTPANEILMGQANTTVTGVGALTLSPTTPSYLSGQINALVTGITVDTTGNPMMQFVVDDGGTLFGTNVLTQLLVNGAYSGLTTQTGRLTLTLMPFTTTQAWPCPVINDLGGTPDVRLVSPACGYIAYDTSAQQLTAVTYMASTVSVADGLTETFIGTYQPTIVVLSGPVTFLGDGRLALTMSGTTAIILDLSALFGPGITAVMPTIIYTRLVSTIPSIWN